MSGFFLFKICSLKKKTSEDVSYSRPGKIHLRFRIQIFYYQQKLSRFLLITFIFKIDPQYGFVCSVHAHY